jgi:hypothetical protein
MRIEKVAVKNVRNLAEIEVRSSPEPSSLAKAVSARAHFIQALRLVLDPTVPNPEPAGRAVRKTATEVLPA